MLNKSHLKWEKNNIFEIWAHNTYFVSDRHNTNMKSVLWNLKKLFRQVVNTYEHFEDVKNLKFVKYLKFLFLFDLLLKDPGWLKISWKIKGFTDIKHFSLVVVLVWEIYQSVKSPPISH